MRTNVKLGTGKTHSLIEVIRQFPRPAAHCEYEYGGKLASTWVHRLIVQHPSYGLDPIFVETQRGDICRKSETIHPKPQSLAVVGVIGFTFVGVVFTPTLWTMNDNWGMTIH